MTPSSTWLGRGRGSSGGFSLVEVCLAILVVGLGLLAVFSLFPSGLRSAEDDTADTRAGLFIESVMGGMRANALTITNRAQWLTDDTVRTNILGGVLTINSQAASLAGDTNVHAVIFPDGSGDYLRYRLALVRTNIASGALSWYAVLEVEDGQYPLTSLRFPSVAYTEFWYSGL